MMPAFRWIEGPKMKIVLSVFALTGLIACGGTPPASQTPATIAASQSGAGFTDSINSFRAAQGLGAMQTNAALARAAWAHAEDMERRGYFSHASQGGPNGVTFVDRAAAAGCVIRGGAENIAQGQRSERAAFEAWRNSPGHRANMLRAGYTQYGLGRAGNTWVMKISDGC
jgi:uncharacterized protein YkwD